MCVCVCVAKPVAVELRCHATALIAYVRTRCRSAVQLDQLCSNRAADQRLCFCYIDSTIPLLPKSKISIIQPTFVTVQPGLCYLDLVGNPEDMFSHDAAHI